MVLPDASLCDFPRRDSHISLYAHTHKQKRYRLSINEAFERVIQECGKYRIDMEGAWLGKDITEAYTEAPPPRLCGECGGMARRRTRRGLYGVCIGCAFFGESMFSRVASASKLALIHLCANPRQKRRQVNRLPV